MASLEEIFNKKINENGDESYYSTNNHLLDLLFMTEYYSKHLDEIKIGDSHKEKIFSMFIRDPRLGLGKRDMGRRLMQLSNVSLENMAKAGRYDDIALTKSNSAFDFLKKEIENGNETVKKWMPRLSSKNNALARMIAKYWGMDYKTYRKFIKTDTTEQHLSRKETDKINFSHVPSLAMLKYAHRFATKDDTKERFMSFMSDVKNGNAKVNISTATVYDIYRNRNKIDADVFFEQIEKIKGSWIPIVDSSGSMMDSNDSFGKAMAVGHYLSKCSTYAPNKIISFSSCPQLLTLGEKPNGVYYESDFDDAKSQYMKEIASMWTGDYTNTNFAAVMALLKDLDKEHAPEYLVVLSDMEFDRGSTMTKDETMLLFKENGIDTKIIWWNFNSRNTTAPETDKYGNIFMSGYSPMLLKYLETGFNGEQFLEKLLEEYEKKISA